MRKEYDFSKSTKNPYAKRLKRQVTIRLDDETVDYFKRLAVENGIAYTSAYQLVSEGMCLRKTKTIDEVGKEKFFRTNLILTCM